MANSNRKTGHTAADKGQNRGSETKAAATQANASSEAESQSKSAESDAQTERQSSTKGGKVDVLRVTAKRDQFFRAARRFGRTERVLAIEGLVVEEIAQLRAEPMLVVVDDQVDADQVTG